MEGGPCLKAALESPDYLRQYGPNVCVSIAVWACLDHVLTAA